MSSTYIILPNLPKILRRKYCYYHLYFGDEETKTQKGKVTYASLRS